MKKYYLYYLIDPNDGIVRYVGITNNTKRRYSEHIKSPKYETNHKSNWILKLINNNQKPIMKIINESFDRNEIIQLEIENINKLDNLTNATSGGDYFTYSPDVIEKLKLINKGENNPNYHNYWNNEQKKKQSEKYKGRKLTEDWKNNQRLSMKNRLEVTINGITYPSISFASKSLNMGYHTIKKIYMEQQKKIN